jgi:hypothetical protein
MNGNGGELSSFLEKLSEDTQLQQNYASDPEGTLRRAGLSDETTQILLSRDLERIKGVLDKELPGVVFVMFMVIFQPKT